jgi:tetratricopeptide (TPR) repeat protein
VLTYQIFGGLDAPMRIPCALLRSALVVAFPLFAASLLPAQDSANLLLQSIQATSQIVSVNDLNVPARLKLEYEKARTLLVDKHDTEKSIATIQKVIDEAPSFSHAHFLLAMVYMNSARWADAEPELRTVISLNDKSGFAYLALGSSLFEQGKLAEAEQTLLRADELIPGIPRVSYELARTYYALGRFQDAEPKVRETVAMNPSFPEGHMVLGYVLLHLRKNEEASDELQTYLRLAPDGPASVPIRRFLTRWDSALQRCAECTAD